MKTATDDQNFRESMEMRGSVIELMTPEDANVFIRDQYDTFKVLVDKLGMRIEG
jgi:tripartite-type tricarboxylate transporter receptor subunit TctC